MTREEYRAMEQLIDAVILWLGVVCGVVCVQAFGFHWSAPVVGFFLPVLWRAWRFWRAA